MITYRNTPTGLVPYYKLKTPPVAEIIPLRTLKCVRLEKATKTDAATL